MSTIFTFREFARDLVTKGEIDAPYVFMANAATEKGGDWIDRFALYYFMFYDLDGAAIAADHPGPFWEYVLKVYSTAKRGKTRRHFRGSNGWTAVHNLMAHGSPSQVWANMAASNYTDLLANIAINFQGCQIGPYFAWKVMDILDRCVNRPVTLILPEAVKYLPEVPRRGAELLFFGQSLRSALDRVVSLIYNLPAPGVPGRRCSYPEAETILCAAWGYHTGAYKMGDDIRSRHEQLSGHPALLQYLPPNLDCKQYVYTLDPAKLPA